MGAPTHKMQQFDAEMRALMQAGPKCPAKCNEKKDIQFTVLGSKPTSSFKGMRDSTRLDHIKP